jgi:hypothetical protein
MLVAKWFCLPDDLCFVVQDSGENMDGTFASRKKVTQNDLRRIMNEQKRKFSETVKKIDSPLAKYPF